MAVLSTIPLARPGAPDQLIAVSRQLAAGVDRLRFAAPVACVYNPLDYARECHEAYLRRFAGLGADVLLVGMNPGPWGMVQTGVPFGEVSMVRDWMGLQGRIARPVPEHPARPVTGLACTRSEVSGKRLWGFARDRFGRPEAFFSRFFVYNYCPLAFLEESGANRTPDKLPAAERAALQALCDRTLAEVVEILEPRIALGIGKYAEARLRHVLGTSGPTIGYILHPSPANPAANGAKRPRGGAPPRRDGGSGRSPESDAAKRPRGGAPPRRDGGSGRSPVSGGGGWVETIESQLGELGVLP